jgi:hypothetical protein
MFAITYFVYMVNIILRVSYYCRSVNSIPPIINHFVVDGKHHKPLRTKYTIILCYCKPFCFCTLTSYLAVW